MASKIKTTINFLKERIDQVYEASKSSGIPYKQIIRLCIEQYIAQMKKDTFEEHALHYQQDGSAWKKVHFSMKPEEYDIYLDCKKVSRCSFSLLVAIAIDTYLQSVINNELDYSYHVDTYSKFCINEEKHPIYLFSWSKTDKTEKILEVLRE
jgi:predicted DNA-binding protein